MSNPIIRSNVMLDVLEERKRQDERWGEQNHDHFRWLCILMEEVGEATQVANDIVEKLWRGADLAKGQSYYRAELVQVAAVTIAMLEAFDRNGGGK